jgi:hypothetical protein
MAGFFGCLHATNPSIPITVSPAKEIGCFGKNVTALAEQFSNLLTEMPFFDHDIWPRSPFRSSEFVNSAAVGNGSRRIPLSNKGSSKSAENPRSISIGRRNHAILLLLARLGLRAGEVVRLNLEDIDWDNALITICGKARHQAQLPLPMDVGQAIASYLHRGRPRCSCRSLFIRDRAPLPG